MIATVLVLLLIFAPVWAPLLYLVWSSRQTYRNGRYCSYRVRRGA